MTWAQVEYKLIGGRQQGRNIRPHDLKYFLSTQGTWTTTLSTHKLYLHCIQYTCHTRIELETKNTHFSFEEVKDFFQLLF